MNVKQLYLEAMKRKDVKTIVKYKWDYDLSATQEEIVRKIAFLESRRLSISAMTRYGKTQCVSIGLALVIDFGVPYKIAFLGPKQEQAGIIRQYMAELISTDRQGSLLAKAMITATAEERLNKEASRKRMTFKTGAEYRVFSGEGDADRLMGFGCVPPYAEIITNKGIKTAEQVWKTNQKLLIYSYNHERKKCEFQQIKHKIQNPARELIKIHHNKGILVVTDNHPVYVKGKGYIEAKELCEKDKLFNCDCHVIECGNNNMHSMRKHNNKKIKSHSKSKEPLLQSQMQRRMAERKKQLYVGWWGKENYLQRMWRRFFYKQKPKEEKSLLLHEMQRHSKKEKTKAKDKFNLQTLWKNIRSNTSKKRRSILLKNMCQQRTIGKNVDGKESGLEGRNKKFTMGSRFQQKNKNQNKRKRWSQVLFMWKNWILTNTPHRLQQAKQQGRELDDIVSKLSLQDQLQKRDVEEVIITRIEKLPAEKITYNFEVKNNNNYFVNGILTHNCDVLVRDEACLLSAIAYTKSSRMLGDNPENSIIIELYNPWDRDNKAYLHTLSPEWEVIQVDWRTAVAEGRTTEQFVMEQKKELTGLEFDVLYNSKFPDESEDSIFSLKDIKAAEEREFKFEEELQSIERLLEHKHKLKESKCRELQNELKKYSRIVACDPADKGKDQTVIWWGTKYENRYQVVDSYSEDKSDSMQIVGKVVQKAEEFIGRNVKGIIFYDRVGLGTGPLSRTKEVIKEKGLKNITVQGCHFGEASIKKDIYLNKKAENYFRLQSLFKEEMISIPKNKGKLKTQLMAMKWSLTSSSKRKIEDPEDYSPDHSDGLVYLCWKDNTPLSFAFV